MSKMRKAGFLLIILGLFIPSIFYSLTSYTSTEEQIFFACFQKGILYRPDFRDLEVVFVKGKWKRDGHDVYPGHYEGRIAVPYKYPVALGIVLLFSGIAFLVMSQKQKNEMIAEKTNTN